MYKAKKIHIALTFALLFSAKGLYAQQGFGTNEPSKASVIDMQSETKGLLIPRVQLTSLTDFLPVKGETATNVDKTNSLLVYNTATVGSTITPGYYYWTTDGTAINSFWKRLLANNDASALALAGDVTGTLAATVVEKIQGIPVATTNPTNNQVLTYNGTAWTPTAITPSVISNKADLSVTDGIRIASGSGTGALLNAATVGINDRGIAPIKITPGTNGQVLTTNGSGNAVWDTKGSLITGVSNTSSGNSLSTTVNGITGTAVNIINSNTLTLNGFNQLVSTVNGVASSPAISVLSSASNGLNATNGDVKLGGNLTQNTIITNTSAFDLTLATTNSGSTGKLKITGLDKTKVQATTNSGTTTGVTEHLLAVGSDNVVKALKASMPKFFYMPSIIVPIAASQFTAINATAGESFSDATRTGVLNLYERYKAQFGTVGTATQPSSPSAPSLPVLPASELHYYVTWYDTTVFQSVSLDATGKMTYVVRVGVDVTVGSFMNIVFAVKEG